MASLKRLRLLYPAARARSDSGIRDELLCREQPAVCRHGLRACAGMRKKETPELPLADTEPFGECFDASLVERAFFDEAERARHGRRRSRPGRRSRRCFRPAAQAGSKSRLLGRRRRSDETAMRPFGHTSRTDRTAIDAGRGDADEEAPVEARILRLHGAVALVFVEPSRRQDLSFDHVHLGSLGVCRARRSPKSDMAIRRSMTPPSPIAVELSA